jgi:tetratricopeptide (TPR) repeat protein
MDNITAAKTVFSKFPEDPANQSGLARVAFLQKNVTEGNRIVGVVAAKAVKKVWEPLMFAADAINNTEGGNIQQAIDWYAAALKKSDNADLHLSAGDAYLKTPGGGGEAMNNYESVTSKDDKNSLAYTKIGSVWYSAKRYDLALENYQKAKDVDTTNPLPFRNLAMAYYYVGKGDLALQNIEAYLRKSDKTDEDLENYLNILYLAKKYKEAIQIGQELLKKGKDEAGFYGIIGYSQMESKDFGNALNSIRTYFAKKDPKKIIPQDYKNYGKIALGNSMPDTANAYFAKAIAADTAQNKSETYRGIADAFKDAKEFDKSAQWYEKLIVANPNASATDYFWRGTMYYYAKDYENAAKSFEAMHNKYPEQPSAIYWQGRVGAAMDEEATKGTAEQFYLDWLTKVGPNYDKKNDLMQAYQYLALFYFNKKDKENTKAYMDKIEAIDPANAFLKQLKEATTKPQKPAKPATKNK